MTRIVKRLYRGHLGMDVGVGVSDKMSTLSISVGEKFNVKVFTGTDSSQFEAEVVSMEFSSMSEQKNLVEGLRFAADVLEGKYNDIFVEEV